MKKVVEDFYSAFGDLDAERMVAHYHDQCTFHDPAFGDLAGERVKNMWRMLIESQKGKSFIVRYSKVTPVDENVWTVSWEAEYFFSRTGRAVHNRIQATLTFEGDKILNHQDVFSLRKWAGQAMGWKGGLLGGTKFFQKKLQQQTNGLLNKYEANLS